MSKSSNSQTKPQIITHASKSLTFTVYDVKWIPKSARYCCFAKILMRKNGALRKLSKGYRNTSSGGIKSGKIRISNRGRTLYLLF